jgi:hypothetical protein
MVEKRGTGRGGVSIAAYLSNQVAVHPMLLVIKEEIKVALYGARKVDSKKGREEDVGLDGWSC